MYNRSKLDDQLFDNFGIIYNFKHQRLINDYLYEFEIDTDYKRIRYDYWSEATGTDDDIVNETKNIRLLGGIQLSDNVKLKTGIGYRYLKDRHGFKKTTTGHNGYDRIQEYNYIPFIAEIDAPINSINGLLKLEYDHIFHGYNQSRLTTSAGKTFNNNEGYMVKTSYKFPYNNLNLEPYYVFQSVEESTVNQGSIEPSNTTDEYGVKISKIFGKKQKLASDYKTLIEGSSEVYFGSSLLFTRIDTGFIAASGTALLDEKDTGYNLFAGINIDDNLDIEFSYNDFGDAVLALPDENDTFIDVDGKFQNKRFDPGDEIIGNNDNLNIFILSQSVSVALRPIFNQRLVDITPMLGVHRWDQSEHTAVDSFSPTTFDYDGIDLIYGIGVKSKFDSNFNISLDYAEYPMYYDAKVTELKFRYKF
tara:strand:- start:13 stop:1269 length:1257 start_codon:yes stop_codon:yes gene_type:complete